MQLCGDCHLMNFGGFATAKRNMIFDINDFDETYPRTVGMGRQSGSSRVSCWRHRNGVFPTRSRRTRCLPGIASYRERVAGIRADVAARGVVHADRICGVAGVLPRNHARIAGDLRSTETVARRRTSETLFPKLTTVGDGRARIIDNPPLVYHFEEHARRVVGGDSHRF